MTQIYSVKNEKAERIAQRKAVVAEINVLRKFEGRSLIEERIDKNISSLHKMWFNPSSKKK